MIAAVSAVLPLASLVSCLTANLLADEAVAASAPAAAVPEQARDASLDMAQIERRMTEPLLQDVPDATARSLLERIRDDGSWADVDYGDRSRSGWSTIRHLSNVAILACAYRSPNSAFHADGRARDAALAGLDYWLDHDFSEPVVGGNAPDAARATAWVWHDQVAYLSLDTAPIHVRNAPQHGVWRDINQRHSSDEVQQDVFSVWQDHGSGPEGATYAYAVVPGVEASSVAELAGSLPVWVLRNDRQAQAIWHDTLDLGGFAFYEPGVCHVRPDLALSVSKPCLVLLRCSLGELSISVCDPTHKLSTVEVEMLDGTQASGGDASPGPRGKLRLSFALPESPEAGRSVTRPIPR
jgi:hypothetical protein